ncbi:hypothetical protein SSP24_79030 [Streptomyces spinoverrucosus]|uniref:Uncharacterized protein n=1 Tax=Streptomyces spinoverrucosus TaxID=284043 RepID=A0A4Y3VVF7_9ACTN|nr:hypothetical protein [Streptomyces spinoverrucosus]GEC10248.1 hypothetical protein SSP24_79030 [Streptomyces spinoverrucosus]GHB97873.1 hypothetical protein GCM10010397_83010 [Streptomyces spinoverrucosus]
MGQHFSDADLAVITVGADTYSSLSGLMRDTALFAFEPIWTTSRVLCRLQPGLDLDDTKKRERSLKAAYYDRMSGSQHLADDWPELDSVPEPS